MLPTSRNRTYAVDTQIKSADLNDLQDQVIGLYGGKHAAVEQVIPSLDAAHNGSISLASTGEIVLTSGQYAVFPICLPVGSRITSYSAHGQIGTGGDTFTVDLFQAAGTTLSASSPGGTSTQTSGSSAGTFYEPGQTGLSIVMAADTRYFVRVRATVGNAGNIAITAATVGFDKP